MQKVILFLLFLCAHGIARGQAAYDYRYWFDGRDNDSHSGTSTTPAWQLELDLSGLSQNFHSLHFQVKDTVWSSPVTRYFLKVPEKGTKTFTYWFNNDYTRASQITSGSGPVMLDVDKLTDGMHLLHMMYNENGENSLPRTAVFWKQPITGQLSYRLWTDNDRSSLQSGAYTGQPVEVDVSDLEDGFHILHAQVEAAGTASTPYTKMFIKVPQTIGVDYLNCIFMVDSKVYKQEKVPTSTGIVHWEFDASDIPQGLHKAQGLIVTPSGVASNLKEGFFFRTMTTAEKASMQCYYSIDGDTHRTQAGKLSGDLFHFDLDVSELTDGFHRISYMLMADNGMSSKVMSAFFIKTPLGGNGIMQYNYWLNENKDRMQVVRLDKRTNPFKLITLLPVETCPIRSSCFQLEIEDGQPVVYARNDLHMRFYDVSGRLTEATERYTDYNVSQTVEDIEPLTDEKGSVSSKRPEENGILWYSMPAAIGDSIAIRSNQACTVQIFAPDGKEVYTASGAESVAYGGCHAYQNGTYYIALHDVTSTSTADINLEYQHIDKYAILAYSPDYVGTPSTFNIELLGNGFNDSVRVALYKDDVTYWAKNVSSSSLSELTAQFDIADSLDETYSLKVLYTVKDSICIENAINTAPRDSIPDVSISLEGNPYFLAGTSATYMVKFTNHSNIPVYNLPFTLSIFCSDGENTITGIKFGDGIGRESKEKFREWLQNYLDEPEIEELLNNMYGDDDMKYFFMWKDSVSQKVYLIGHFTLPYLNANSTLSIPLTITKAEHNFTLYASTKKHWDYIYNVIKHGDHANEGDSGGNGNGNDDSDPDGSGNSSSPGTGGGSGSNDGNNYEDDECCVMSAATCMTRLILTIIPMTELVDTWVDECVFDHLQNGIGGIFNDIYCEGRPSDYTRQNKSPQPTFTDVTQSVIKCSFENALNIGGQASVKKALNFITKKLAGKVLTLKSLGEDCIINPYKTWVNGCGEDDDDDAEANPINSYDPNDIYGYQAQSGSKAIKKGLEEVYYTIEFENDPEFASTSAHEVTVTDTLDHTRFDLDSFRPTGLKIGDRQVELDGEPSTIVTVDMRPEVNAIAQMNLDYNAEKGIAKWKFISLDPMTMEPTDNPMSGFLPVNSDGNGIGEVSFHIGLRSTLDDGDKIENRAAIVFDQNDPIITPTWTNIVDTIAPQSRIISCETKNDNTIALRFEGSDNRSGIWKYDVYAQQGAEAPWIKIAEDVEDDEYEFEGFEGINYGFYVVATDSAGNVEPKVPGREISQPTYKTGDANGDGIVNVVDATLAIGKFLGKEVYLNFEATDCNKDGLINAIDVSLIRQTYLSTVTRMKKAVIKRERIQITQ